MEMFEVEGGVPLHGEVTLSGSKNAALPMMAAAILAEGKVTLRRVPHLRDINTMIEMLPQLGVEVEWAGPDSLELEARDESLTHAPYKWVKIMRASICVLGPLLGKSDMFSDFRQVSFRQCFFEANHIQALFDVTLQQSVHHQVGVSSYGAGEMAVVGRS